ncbi:MAG: hypothetical protein JXA67_00090 [Micromonosporaceae bacterium]|nr:hypothetical protein [Micromonosporaceae bacterium]
MAGYQRFDHSHPLATVAGERCRASSHQYRPIIGEIACSECWERSIRDDEKVVVEYGLPREIIPDPTYVDEIAVDLACRGMSVHLTPIEQASAVMRLHRRGWPVARIARWLHLSSERTKALTSGSEPSTPPTVPALVAA